MLTGAHTPRISPNPEEDIMRKVIFTVIYIVAITIAAGCSEDPVAPDPGNNGGGDPYVDVPAIPEPTSPGGSVPQTSAVLTKVLPLNSLFKPTVTNVHGNWQRIRLCGQTVQFSDRYPNTWSSDLPGRSDFVPLLLKLERIALQNDSGEREAVQEQFSKNEGLCGTGLINFSQTLRTAVSAPQLQNAVYIRRDRHWELQHIENVGEYLLLDPNTQGEISSTYMRGVTNTQTEEFGESITAEAGLGIGPLQASISGTLSRTFSNSVEVSTSEEQTFTKTVWGEPGKQIQFMVWELVEVYTLSDENREPFTDPNYKMQLSPLERRGAALKLQATQFDL
jgi:hypothetical protein